MGTNIAVYIPIPHGKGKEVIKELNVSKATIANWKKGVHIPRNPAKVVAVVNSLLTNEVFKMPKQWIKK